MGVAATATVSVVQHGRLTGMFVMHHTEPRSLSLSDRLALATVSRIASFVAATMNEKSFGARRIQSQRSPKNFDEISRPATTRSNASRRSATTC